MKLVIDTNVLISGSLWRGAPAQLLDAALSGRARIFLSKTLLLELDEVLRRPKFTARLTAQGETAAGIVARLRDGSFEIAPARILPPENFRDPDDLHILACALAAQADAVVSGDDDLRALGSFRGIPILDVPSALLWLGRGK